MDLYIKGVPPVATNRSTAQLMKTGQTTSYRTGDDGDLERGRNVSFMVLAENNPFGNTNRFTDELGGQTYTKNIVIDWSTYDSSTVLGWRRDPINGGNWNTAIDQSLLVSIPPFTTGWRLPNIKEALNLINYGQVNGLNNSPFFTLGSGIWTATTSPATITSAYWIYNYYNTVTEMAKSSSTNYIPCRTFTVTGTTLS
jgi:hypothetical protein